MGFDEEWMVGISFGIAWRRLGLGDEAVICFE